MNRYVGHLPGVRLADASSEVELAQGRLRQIAFDEWHQLDSWFPFRARDYGRTAPVFLEIPLTNDPDDLASGETAAAFQNGTDAASATRAIIYRCLLLMSGEAIPNPDLSMSYFSWGTADGSPVFRRVGAANRELIVFGSEMGAISVKPSAASAIDELEPLMRVADGPVDGVVQAIVRTARPEFGVLNQVLHLVAALEHLLVRRGEPLTETFARRFSVLASVQSARDWYDEARAAYDLRSDLIHGRPSAPTERLHSDEFLIKYLRVLTCQITIRMVHLLEGPHDLEKLLQELDLAFHEPARREQLARRWGDI